MSVRPVGGVCYPSGLALLLPPVGIGVGVIPLQRAGAAVSATTDEPDRIRLAVLEVGLGGRLGRGGGPAARGILSLPPESLDGSLRLTEQGEVLAERYDDTQIAHRHLEQVTWATLVASARPGIAVKPAWRDLMEELATRSFKAYRELVDQPGFIQFFTSTTCGWLREMPCRSTMRLMSCTK